RSVEMRVWGSFCLALAGTGLFLFGVGAFPGCGGSSNTGLEEPPDGSMVSTAGGNGAAGSSATNPGATPGRSDKDCRNQAGLCDTMQGICVECLADSDCGANEQCAANVCRQKCMSDKDCTAAGLLCDARAGHCVECLAASDCSRGQSCVNQ